MQYNPYLWPNRLNFRVVKEKGVEKHDGDGKSVSCTRNASCYNYRNSSFIVDYGQYYTFHRTCFWYYQMKSLEFGFNHVPI